MRGSVWALAAMALVACDSPAVPAPAPAETCAMHPVLMDEFDEASIAPTRIGPARWTAHTPWSGDFGDARFTDPGPDGPFSVKDGVLRIKAWKDTSHVWRSGLIAGSDSTGAGVGTRYGYFETRMKFPPGPGTWPAFWLAALKSATVKDGDVEIDVVEYYGQFPDAYRVNLHVWYADHAKIRGTGEKIDVPEHSLVDAFHTYGVDVSPQAIVFFLDRKKVWSQPTPNELDGPLYPLVNLATGGGWPIAKTPNPSVLLVDYVHVWGRGPGPPGGCPAGPPP